MAIDNGIFYCFAARIVVGRSSAGTDDLSRPGEQRVLWRGDCRFHKKASRTKIHSRGKTIDLSSIGINSDRDPRRQHLTPATYDFFL